MDIFNQLGELALAARMKRLYENIMRDGLAIYESYGLDFDPNNFSVFYLISQKPETSITELSELLGFSHPTVINQVKALDKKGLVCSQKAQQDKRKRLVCLSEKGKALVPQLEQAWQDIAETLFILSKKQKHPLLASIMELEQIFKKESFAQRVINTKHHREGQKVSIIDFSDQSYNYFKEINLEWITHYFEVEEEDEKVLNDPKKYIIDKGGVILYAQYQGEVVGTCGLKKWDNDSFELVKMGVKPQAQGKQIGKKLGLAIIEKAKTLGAKSIFLESNRSLTPAINLYKRLGFIEVPSQGSCSDYQRCDITMERQLIQYDH